MYNGGLNSLLIFISHVCRQKRMTHRVLPSNKDELLVTMTNGSNTYHQLLKIGFQGKRGRDIMP